MRSTNQKDHSCGSHGQLPATFAMNPKTRFSRASWACATCRRRKLRCDASVSMPCSECKKDGSHCKIPTWGKRRYCFDSKDSLTPEQRVHRALSRYYQSGYSYCTRPKTDINEPAIALPSYITPLKKSLSSVDLQYLQSKGACVLPRLELQEVLLCAYVDFVHPTLPVLQLPELLSLSQGSSREGLGQISCFVYQALLFSAATLIKKEQLEKYGCPSPHIAAHTFFARSRLLYEFDSEDNTIALIQGLLLMTLRLDPRDGYKDAWHWNGIALSLLESILAGGEMTSTTISRRQQSLRKRLWWCCYMREQHIAVTLHRPPRILNRHHQILDLEQADFDFVSRPDDNNLFSRCSSLSSPDNQHHLAQIFIERTRLSVIQSQVMRRQFSVQMRQSNANLSTSDSVMMFFPNTTPEKSHHIDMLDAQLKNLVTCLPISYRRPVLCRRDLASDSTALQIQQNLLQLMCDTISIMLHSPQTLSLGTGQTRSLDAVRQSTQNILNRILGLYELGFVRLMPSEIVMSLLPALTNRLRDLGKNSTGSDPQAMWDTMRCMQVMETLRDIHGGVADDAAAFTSCLLQSLSTGKEPRGLSSLGETSEPSPANCSDFAQSASPASLALLPMTPDTEDVYSTLLDSSLVEATEESPPWFTQLCDANSMSSGQLIAAGNTASGRSYDEFEFDDAF